MMRRTVVVLFILNCVKNIYSLFSTDCVTPNGEEASCISIFACTVITNALASNDYNAILFAQKSQCGYERVPLVCCGSTGRLILPDVLSIFSKPQLEDNPIILEKFNTNALPNRTICGLEKETDRILSGKIALIHEFPWMAGLEYKSKYEVGTTAGIRCGGSLITNRYVLTAAHCMDTIEFELFRVWLGDWKISSDPDCLNQTVNNICNDPVLKIRIARKIPHTFYHNGLNDIALLKLEREVSYTVPYWAVQTWSIAPSDMAIVSYQFSTPLSAYANSFLSSYLQNYIRPICLPPPNLPYPKIGTRLTVTGWGSTNQWGDLSDVKLKVDVPIKPTKECRVVSRKRIITDSQLCAGGEYGKDACSGDSGGPLMKKYVDGESNQLQWYLEGIVSWGDGCGRVGIPGVYTRMASYVYWVMYSISEEEITSDFDFDAARKLLLPSRSICGLSKKGNNSMDEIGSGITNVYEFPWIVRLEYGIKDKNKKFICGGSLISNRYVLTAASCFDTIKYEFIRVWLGDRRNSNDPDCVNQTTNTQCNDAILKLKISKPIMYPYHTSFGINDIALLKLEQKVTFTDYIRPVCLPYYNFMNPPNGTRLMLSGWGTARKHEETSNYKIKIEKYLVPNNRCVELYRRQYKDRIVYLEYNTLCAGGECDTDLCQGDGGGGAPLMKEFEDGQNDQRQWFQVGINSWGFGCGEPGKPCVYTKVSRFVNWILRTLSDDG